MDSRILHLLSFLKYLINTNSSRNNFKRYYCNVRTEYFFLCVSVDRISRLCVQYVFFSHHSSLCLLHFIELNSLPFCVCEIRSMHSGIIEHTRICACVIVLFGIISVVLFNLFSLLLSAFAFLWQF